jgi:uncharacterized cupredoxin-like copper-binding protein
MASSRRTLVVVGVVSVAAALAMASVGLGVVRAADHDPNDPTALGPGRAPVLITIEHSRFVPDRLTVRAGTEVRFVLANDDPIIHELIVGGPEVHERHASGTEAKHDPIPGEVTIEPDRLASTTFRFDRPGIVQFACHLPGHFAYGMTGEVVVVP